MEKLRCEEEGQSKEVEVEEGTMPDSCANTFNVCAYSGLALMAFMILWHDGTVEMV